MSVVASWDFANRIIRMGVADWHPADIYREYRAYRAAHESVRQFAPLLRYEGNLPKGGGKFTPRYMTLLGGTKILPLDGATAPVTNITGEVITDDQSAPLTYAGLTIRPLVNYAPPAAEVIQVSTSGSSPDQIAAAVVAALASSVTPANLVQVRGHAITGTGGNSDPWGPA
jgi:hypothetical protein